MERSTNIRSLLDRLFDTHVGTAVLLGTTMNEVIELEVMRSALEATRSAVIITDALVADDPIIYANQAFYELTGYTQKEVMGKNCRFLQGKDTDPKDIDKIRQAVKQRKHIQITIKNYRKNGEPFWNDLIMSPVMTGNELTHFVGLQLDVTDRINYQHQLEESRKALVASNLELEQFTYAASHDLQEPLRMVSSFMNLVEQNYGDKLDDKGREYISFAVNGAERMQGLINDLLLLSRVRTKRQPTKVIKLSTVISDAVFNLKAIIDDTKAKVTFESEDVAVALEEVQMVQVFQNLIGNAIKYRRPKVAPKVRVTAKVTKDNLEIAVIDNGIGIAQKYQERIFGVFQRLHTRSEYPGNGVGLSLCRKIIEQHGGTLNLSSEVGVGSTFLVTIPIRKQS